MLKLIEDLNSLANPDKARILSRFFKTGKGDYGEGDIFLGVSVPATRSIARRYLHLSFMEIDEMLVSRIHEHRLAALLVLVEKFRKSDELEKTKIYEFYLKNTGNVNNWDLVDLSADKIVGTHLLDKNKDILYKLAKSESVWERRIAIIATFAFIKNGKFDDALKISELLLRDSHDLIQKAVGWMLREIGKRNQESEEGFLREHYRKMPRTMLRYAIERFDKKKKEVYMSR